MSIFDRVTAVLPQTTVVPDANLTSDPALAVVTVPSPPPSILSSAVLPMAGIHVPQVSAVHSTDTAGTPLTTVIPAANLPTEPVTPEQTLAAIPSVGQ